MKYLIILLLLLGFSFWGFSQVKKSKRNFKPFYTYYIPPKFYKHWDIGVSTGTSHYSGEIANKTDFYSLTHELKFQSGIQLNYFVTKNASIGAEATFGRWYASDINHQNRYDRNFYGESVFIYPSLIIKQRFFHKWRLQPLIKFGIGVNMHKTNVFKISDGTPMSDNGIKFSIGWNFGGGITYHLNKRLELGLDVFLVLYTQDDIDNLVYSNVETDKVGSIRFTFNYKLLKWRD